MAEIQEDRKKIIIQDNGPGISDEYKEHLFDLFVADSHDDFNDGFGLGLATAKLIMDMLSAEIEVTSPQTGGTRVIMTFFNRAPRLDENPNF
jgi:K+-sensing histidine kinase KdpD